MWRASLCWDGIIKTKVGEKRQRDPNVLHMWEEKRLKREAKWQHSRASHRQEAFSELLLCICIITLGRQRVGNGQAL